MADWPDTAGGILEEMPSYFLPDKAQGARATFQFELSGDGGGTFVISVADGQCSVSEGPINSPSVILKMAASDFMAMAKGELDAMKAFMGGRIKGQGELGLAMRFSEWFDRPT